MKDSTKTRPAREPLPKRSKTIGVNVVQRSRSTTINVFTDGSPTMSRTVEGQISIGQALITVGAEMQLEPPNV
jgi:hypothetical protein